MQFDPFKQAKIQVGLAKIQTGTPGLYANTNVTSVADIKRLAGIGTGVYPADTSPATAGANMSVTANEKAQLMKQNNIKPGSQEWFQLWFSLPYLTGEPPVGK